MPLLLWNMSLSFFKFLEFLLNPNEYVQSEVGWICKGRTPKTESPLYPLLAGRAREKEEIKEKIYLKRATIRRTFHHSYYKRHWQTHSLNKPLLSVIKGHMMWQTWFLTQALTTGSWEEPQEGQVWAPGSLTKENCTLSRTYTADFFEPLIMLLPVCLYNIN